MLLTITYPTLPHRNSVRVSQVMDHFGIGWEVEERVIARDLDLPIAAGQVVLFTGPSGSGKSSLLRAVVQSLTEGSGRERSDERGEPEGERERQRLLHLSTLDLGSRSLVDSIPLPFDETLQLLAMCGLGEAPLMLRTPQELSEGQRYRFALALAVAHQPEWIIADEFAAVLDRTTARVIAYNVRRIADRFGIGFLLATAQDDLETDLQPNLNVRCDLDGRVVVMRREGREPEESPRAAGRGPEGSSGHSPSAISHQPQPSTINHQPSTPSGRKKKEPRSPSTPNCGSAWPPSPTGRTSLGGIIGVTKSV